MAFRADSTRANSTKAQALLLTISVDFTSPNREAILESSASVRKSDELCESGDQLGSYMKVSAILLLP